MRPWRLGATLLMLFGAIALLMGGVGIYAAFAHVVASRGRELAIRAALGAERRHLTLMVLTHVLQIGAAGVVLGTLMALAGGQFIASQLFQTVPYDPAVLATAACLVAALAVIGGALPARTAGRTNPQELLRV
jgi:ABC-type antimicrobial peptide transport system permease subunit